MIEELKKRIENATPCLIHKAIEPSFTWETAVGYLQHCADTEIGNPIGPMNYMLPLAESINSVIPVKEYLSENLTEEIIGTEMMVTLTTKDIQDKYTSEYATMVWNVLGYSELNIDDEDRTVEPGDLFFLPAGTSYTYKPETARTAIIFTLGKE